MKYPTEEKLIEKVTLYGHNSAVTSVIFTPDKKHIVSSDLDSKVKLWDFKSKKEISSLKNTVNKSARLIATSPDYMAYVNAEQITILTLENKQVITTLNHDKPVNCIEFSPDGKTLASAADDCKIKLWDCENWQEICTFAGHTLPVLAISFNAEGTYIVSGSADKTIKLWDIKFLTIEGKAVNEHNNAKHLIQSNKSYQPEPLLINPIGVLYSSVKERYEAPRQGVHARETTGVIQLNPYSNFEQAVRDLEGFERIWVFYQFHLNLGWKPLVSPPRFLERKIGVFATRSPFRPNPLGMSCVKLLKVEKLKIYIAEFDILDQTPIIDIKPYLPYSDSFPESRTGWLENRDNEAYNVILAPLAKTQSDWLVENYDFNIENYCKVQLQFEPENDARKRIHRTGERAVLQFRTWRIDYTVDNSEKQVTVLKIRSQYSSEELMAGMPDKKGDKDSHRKFTSVFKIN
jgi:tRNA-Thr(GGU) m(6)t(6)A37 methyltransferase TsaA